MKTFNFKNVGLALLVLAGIKADGALLYNTFPNYNSASFVVANGQQFGNQIFTGSTFTITNFNFEYFTTNTTFAGNVGVDLKFYKNDGPLTNTFATPGTLIYDSGLFTNGLKLTAGGPGTNGFNVVNYNTSDFGALLMPTNFTFVITFSNLVGSDEMEIPLAGATNMFGRSFGDYWFNNGAGSGWTLLTNAAPASFVASISGTPTPVPEPSVLGLGAVAGVLLLARKLRKRTDKSVKVE